MGTSLSGRAEQHYEVISSQVDQLLRQIEHIVEDAAGYFSRCHEFLRESYNSRSVPHLGYLDEALMKK